MLPMKKPASLRFAAGSAASDWPMCDSDALANTTPWASSPDSATMRLRSAATMMGGRGPNASSARNFSMKARVSASGLPGVTPIRTCDGPCAMPMPSRNRPPETSCIIAALCAKSTMVRW
jgi:hypothetical protein